MQPRVNWTMSSYRKAQDVIASGEGSDEDRTHLSAMAGDFEQDMAEGWEPASGEEKAPATRTAQEVGIGGGYDPTRMRGQLTGPLVGPSRAPPSPEIDDDVDTLENAEAQDREPTLYDTALRSASHQKVLFADPIYTPEPGEIDPLTGLAAAGEGFAEPEQPYFHQEPSVEQFVDYLKRAKESTDRPEMQARWDEALASARDKEEESPYFAEFADRQWQEVRKVMAAHRVPVTRIAYQDVAKGKLGDRLEGEFARIAEPFIAGADQGATWGAGTEAVAMHGNKRYSEHQEQALAELEENGTLMPMAARIRDVMETSPWMAGTGIVAGTLAGGLSNLVFRAGAKATAATGKLLAHMTPSLLRGTSMGAQAARGVAKHGLAGGGAALIEESARGEVAAAGRAIREEEDTGIGAPMGPGEAFLTGGLGATLGGAAVAGVRGMAKSLRLTSDKATREAIGKVEDLLPGQRGTAVLRGIKETPEMKAVLETELRAGTSAGRKTGVEAGFQEMRGEVAKLGREQQEAAFKAAGQEKVAFHAANETNLKSMQESSDRMLLVARNREGTPFADDESFFKAFRDVTEVKPVSSKSEAQALVKASGGGQVMSMGDAKRLFGAKYVKAKLGKLKTDNPELGDVVDDAPIELLPRGQGFMSGPLQEPAEAALDSSPIHFVVTGKKLNPRQYDDAVDALNRKIRYGEGDAYKDPEWKQLGLAIRKDRDQFGGEWGATKKRHEDVANVWAKRRKDFGIKADWNERDQLQLDSIHKALRKAGNVDDATDAEIWALLEKKPGLVKKLQVLKATEARRELMSGNTTPTRWGIMRELYGGARLRVDPMLGGMVGDPLSALGPTRLGMLTPPSETVQDMGSASKDLLQRLFRMTPTPEGQDDVSPPSN